MRGKKLDIREIEKITKLRKTGHSLPEIRKITGKSNATVFKYLEGVKVLKRYRTILKEKQGGSKIRALKKWENSRAYAQSLIPNLTQKEKILILASLYWGEGTKSELSLSNTDPSLIKSFVSFLGEIGVKKDMLRVTVRIYQDIDKEKAIHYWAGVVGIPEKAILNVNILYGKKQGKLKYGMCRVRVKKSEYYFKRIMSVIELIRFHTESPHSSMDRTRDS